MHKSTNVEEIENYAQTNITKTRNGTDELLQNLCRDFKQMKDRESDRLAAIKIVELIQNHTFDRTTAVMLYESTAKHLECPIPDFHARGEILTSAVVGCEIDQDLEELKFFKKFIFEKNGKISLNRKILDVQDVVEENDIIFKNELEIKNNITVRRKECRFLQEALDGIVENKTELNFFLFQMPRLVKNTTKRMIDTVYKKLFKLLIENEGTDALVELCIKYENAIFECIDNFYSDLGCLRSRLMVIEIMNRLSDRTKGVFVDKYIQYFVDRIDTKYFDNNFILYNMICLFKKLEYEIEL